MLSMNTAIILTVMAFAFALILRVVVWLAWNLEIVTSRRQLTLFKLAGVAFVLLFACPGIAIFLLNVGQMLGLLTVSGG